MVSKSFPASPSENVSYAYNNLNLQTAASFYGASVGFGYSGFGELKTERSTVGTLTYQYDKHSNQTRITFPDNQFFTYEYDNLDRFTGIKENGTSQVISQTYRAQGTPWQMSRNNNNSSVTEYDHDDINRLTDLDWQRNGAPVNEFDFTYNRAGQLASQSISNHSLVHQGNTDIRGSWEVNGLNQYSSINGNSYLYDNNANLQFDGGTTYTYDSENRLKHASGTKVVTLTYDPMGRLLSKIAGGVIRRYLYSGDALVAEYSGSTLLKRYVHGPGIDNPLVKYTGSSVNQASRRYLHSNHQGSIIATTDHAGTILETNTYDSFGVPAFSAAMSSNDIRFSYTGQIYLPELEMYHYKARVYDPKLGRFLQTDPIGYDDQMNLYAYVGNDPLSNIDPMGLYTCSSTGNIKTCEGTADEVDAMAEEMEGYTVSSATDGFQSSGSWGEIKSDIASIKSKFDKVINQMNEDGMRRDGEGWLNGYLNNAGRLLGTSYLGCTDQTLHCYDQMTSSDFLGTLNFNWTFDMPFKPFMGTTDNGFSVFPHNWVEAQNTDFININIKLDTHQNSFGVRFSGGR